MLKLLIKLLQYFSDDIKPAIPESTSPSDMTQVSAKTSTLVRVISCGIFHHISIKSEMVSLHNDGKCQEIQIRF